MSFFVNKPKGGQVAYCRFHSEKIIQLGSCLTCDTVSSICEFKGCIKHHEENERVHNVVTIEYVRNIVAQFVKKDSEKRSHLKKLVSDYFLYAKKQLEQLFDNIYNSINDFKFENIILNDDEIDITNRLMEERYNEISCAQVALILPKLKKCSNFEDGHFVHLQDFIAAEKENVPKILNANILNLPYFRDYERKKIIKNDEKFTCEIASEQLKQVNVQLGKISKIPKKLRIKFIDIVTMKVTQSLKVGRQFIRHLVQNESLNEVGKVQLYCVWDVKQQEFQVAFFEAMMRLPYLKEIVIVTGYKVTDANFIFQVVSEEIDVKIYKQQWHF